MWGDGTTCDTEQEAGLRDQYLGPISHVLEEDTKEYQHQKKKLENRRLDYDAKRTNLQKSKKDDKTDLENEMNAAKAKFEETVNTLRDIMAKIAANEVRAGSGAARRGWEWGGGGGGGGGHRLVGEATNPRSRWLYEPAIALA